MTSLNLKTLSTGLFPAYKADEYKYYLSRLGGGMTFCREKDSRRYYLLNTDIKEAWELVGPTGCFENWNAVAVEICNVMSMESNVDIILGDLLE